MAITKYFKEAVKEKDVQRIRIMMKNSLLIDKTFEEFSDMETLVKDMPDIYKTHDNKTFIEDSSKWSNDYLDQQLVELIDNFSHERIKHVKNIILHIYRYDIDNVSVSNNKLTHTSHRQLNNIKIYALIGVFIILFVIVLFFWIKFCE